MDKNRKKTKRKSGRPFKDPNPGELTARERILETALKLFYKQGINSVGIDKIIAESDVAKMTFFKHFPTKKDLIIAFLKLRDDRYMEWFEKTLDSFTINKARRFEAIPKVIEAWFYLPDFRGCAFINTAVETADIHGECTLVGISHKKRLCEFIEVLARDAGFKRTKKLSEQLVMIIDGATVTAQMEGPKTASELLKEVYKTLVKSYH